MLEVLLRCCALSPRKTIEFRLTASSAWSALERMYKIQGFSALYTNIDLMANTRYVDGQDVTSHIAKIFHAPPSNRLAGRCPTALSP